jgi:hypothetical protein
MKTTPRAEASRVPASIPGSPYRSINKFDSAGTLPQGDYLELLNVDLYSTGYCRNRKGSSTYSPFELEDLDEILNYVTWDTGDVEFVIVQTTLGVKFLEIGNDTLATGWTVITQFDGITPWVPNPLIVLDMVVSAGRLFCFSIEENSIVEFDAALTPVFRRRDMGLKTTEITAAVVNAGAGTTLEGEYIYAVEVVYKIDNIDFLVSSPNRKDVTGTLVRVVIPPGLTNSVDVTAPSEVDITTAVGDNWTHLRLYRTKRLDSVSLTESVVGLPEELYPVQEIVRGSWTGTFAGDSLLDDSLPVPNIGSGLVLFDEIELSPLPLAAVGTYHNNRIWVSDTDTPDGESVINFSNAKGTKYSELFDEQNRILCQVGDGQRVKKLIGFESDLIVIKEARTGRIPQGTPDSLYEELDGAIGIAFFTHAKYIPQMGIVATTNDRGDFKIFGYDLRWSNYWNGQDVSRSLRDTQETFTERAHFTYWEGKLLWTTLNEIQVLHVDERLGWSEYFINYFGNVNALFTDSAGIRMYLHKEPSGGTNGKLLIFDVGDTYVASDPEEGNDTVRIDYDWEIKTGPFQDREGRSIIEQRYLSVMAAVKNPMTMDVFIVNRTQELYEDEPFALEPTPHVGAPPPFEINELTPVEYQYYSAFKYPSISRIYAERLFYRIQGTGEIFMYPPQFEGWLMIGQRPPDYNFTKVTSNLSLAAYYSGGLRHHLTRPDVDVDQVNLSSVTPQEETQFVLGVPN